MQPALTRIGAAVGLIAATTSMLLGCGFDEQTTVAGPTDEVAAVEVAFVGNAECARCHPRSSADWIQFSNDHNTPIAPVNTPKTIALDPQFQHRLPWYPASEHGADLLPFPVKYLGESLPVPGKAPEPGEHNLSVLGDILGYDSKKIEKLRKAGALG